MPVSTPLHSGQSGDAKLPQALGVPMLLPDCTMYRKAPTSYSLRTTHSSTHLS